MDDFYSSRDFQRFFRGSRRSLVLKADAPKFTILAVSDLYLSLTHSNRDQILGLGLFEAFPGSGEDDSQSESVRRSFMEVIRTGKSHELPVFSYEIRLEDQTLETYYWSNENEPILGDDGAVAYIINNTANVTEQVRQRNAVIESEKRFELMAEGTDVLISVGDASGGAVYFNKAWEYATGRSMTELLEYGWADLMHPGDKEHVLQVFKMAFEKREPWSWEFRMPSKHGGYQWLMARGTPRFSPDGQFQGYISSCVDINSQKQQQLDLAKFNEDLQKLNGKLVDANDELQQAQEQLLGSNVLLAKSEADLKSSNSRLQENERLLQLAIQSSGLGTWFAKLSGETVVLSPRAMELQGIENNQEINLEQFYQMVDDEDRPHVISLISDAVINHGGFVTEYKMHPRKDGKPKWLRATGLVQQPQDGGDVSILGTLLDITDHKLSEQRKNDFISMVSHELKTPLTSIQGYVQLLLAKAEKADDSTSVSMLSRVLRQTESMTSLISGFLNVSKLERARIHIERTRFDLAALVHEMEQETLISVTTHRVVFAPVERTIVNADRHKIAQVIQNLISNAVKYSAIHTTVNVACITVGDLATLSVKDQGMGISEENLPKLFERFYRVEEGNEVVSGFGIGLYLCKEIVQRHQGTIWAESAINKGSIFIFTIPVSGALTDLGSANVLNPIP